MGVRRTQRRYVKVSEIMPLLETGKRGLVKVLTQSAIGSAEYQTASDALDQCHVLARLLTESDEGFEVDASQWPVLHDTCG